MDVDLKYAIQQLIGCNKINTRSLELDIIKLINPERKERERAHLSQCFIVEPCFSEVEGSLDPLSHDRATSSSAAAAQGPSARGTVATPHPARGGGKQHPTATTSQPSSGLHRYGNTAQNRLLG